VTINHFFFVPITIRLPDGAGVFASGPSSCPSADDDDVKVRCHSRLPSDRVLLPAVGRLDVPDTTQPG